MPFLALSVALFLSAAMALAWRVALRSGESGRADAIWALATGAAAIAASAFSSGDPARRSVVGAMAAIWSLRLSVYLWRRAVGGGDDPRYAALKKEWGKQAPRRLFEFLQLQAVASWPLALTVFCAASAPRQALDGRDALAVALFALAIGGEAVADSQMAEFKRDARDRGRICDQGLWAWSRHPNYFSEWLSWLAYPLIAIGLDYPMGWLSLSGPLVMYWLLVHVSGAPPLEEHLKRSRPEAFAVYAKRVSVFWPRPPRH